jgi:hypothetical protein
MNSQLKKAIDIVRKYRGSPAYISQEANLIVDHYENFEKLLSEYLALPSLDGNIKRQELRNRIKTYLYETERRSN